MLSPAPAAPAPASDEPIERLIGEVTAAAAVALMAALQEWQNGKLTPKTRTAGGDLVAQLWELRRATMGELDFEQVAWEQGRLALRQRCNGGGYPTKTGDILIESVLEILDKVVQAQLN
jgi:hypothetical protein